MSATPILQFAFVTGRLPDETQELPSTLEILLAAIVTGPPPVMIPITLVHGWFDGTGQWDFSYNIYQPNGHRLEVSNAEAIQANLSPLRPYFIAYHDVNLLVQVPGRFDIEVLKNEEVVLRYPFFVKVSEEEALPHGA